MINYTNYVEAKDQIDEVKNICLAEIVKELDFFEEVPVEAFKLVQACSKLYRLGLDISDDEIKTINTLEKELNRANNKLDEQERKLNMMDEKLDRILKTVNRSQNDKTDK